MYDMDPVPEGSSAHQSGWFTGEVAALLLQRIDTEAGRWTEQHTCYSLDQDSQIHIPALQCEVQEQINPLRAPAAAEYWRMASETTESATIRSRRSGDRRTLAAIPCFNEEVAIGSVVLMTRSHVDEVLVIDDGCTDNTAKVARDAGATVVSHGTQMGKGRGIKSALEYAAMHDYDCLVFMDGDGQHNPDEIPILTEPILSGNADFVIGFRTFDQMPAYRRFGRMVLDVVSSNGSTITDSQCGFRALGRKGIESMHSRLRGDDFSIESEMLLFAKQKHLRIDEAPINCRYGDFDTSTMNPISHGIEVLGSVIWLTAERRPLLNIGLPGLVVMLAGVYFALRSIQEFTQTGILPVEQGMLASLFVIPGTAILIAGLVLALGMRMRE